MTRSASSNCGTCQQQQKKPGNKKVCCPHCGRMFKAKRLESHLARRHKALAGVS